jgi:hypothetical protein
MHNQSHDSARLLTLEQSAASVDDVVDDDGRASTHIADQLHRVLVDFVGTLRMHTHIYRLHTSHTYALRATMVSTHRSLFVYDGEIYDEAECGEFVGHIAHTLHAARICSTRRRTEIQARNRHSPGDTITNFSSLFSFVICAHTRHDGQFTQTIMIA